MLNGNTPLSVPCLLVLLRENVLDFIGLLVIE